MIKKLRAKFIAVIMVIVTLMLLVIFGFVLHNTHHALEQEAIESLQSYGKEPVRPGHRPGRHMPVFALKIGPDGNLMISGSDYFDLTDEKMLLQIYEAAVADGKKNGTLPTWELRYYREDSFGQVSYAFMDISAQKHMMEELLTTCCLMFVAAICVFFAISVLLSKWIVRPVEEAWSRQKQFVADASHELKTPLTVILTNAELLHSGEYSPADHSRFADSILTMSRQMRGLVENLLELARVDNGQARRQMSQLDFTRLVEDCCLSFEPVYFEAGRELVSGIAPDIRVRGSDSHLRQVVEILLDNGCKYGAPGKPVELRLEKQGHHCLLSVASYGETLTARQCKEIFKRFYRVDEARAMNHSYGLGLPIAEGIVTEHRGKIWASGKEGVNTFSVTLPIL